MGCIELQSLMIDQLVNKRSKILPALAIFHKADLSNQFSHFAQPILMPRFKSINFHQNRPKITLFLQKCKSFKRLGLHTQTLEIAGHYGFLPTRLCNCLRYPAIGTLSGYAIIDRIEI